LDFSPFIRVNSWRNLWFVLPNISQLYPQVSKGGTSSLARRPLRIKVRCAVFLLW